MSNIDDIKKFQQKYLTFTGFLSDDPKINFYESGKTKTTFSVPLKKNKDDTPVWLNCECWGKLAEKISCDFKKNDEITVIGYLKSQEYEGKEYIHFVVKGAF